MESRRTLYSEKGKWYTLASEKTIVADGEDLVVLLGKKEKEFARVRRQDVVDILPVLDTDGDYDTYYASFRLADGSSIRLSREGSSAEKKVRATCDAVKEAIGL